MAEIKPPSPTKKPRPMLSPADALAARNKALGLVLGAIAFLFYALTIFRFGGAL